MKVVILPSSRVGRLYPSTDMPGTHISCSHTSKNHNKCYLYKLSVGIPNGNGTEISKYGPGVFRQNAVRRTTVVFETDEESYFEHAQ